MIMQLMSNFTGTFRQMPHLKPIFFALSLISFSTHSWALTCDIAPIAPRPVFSESEQNTTAPVSLNTQEMVQQISADDLTQPEPEHYQFIGHVELKRFGQRLNSDFIDINQRTGITELKGNIVFHQLDFTLTADHALINETEQFSRLDNARYQLYPSLTYGQAQQVELQQNKQQARFSQATMTTCPTRSDGTQAWHIAVDGLSLNQTTQRMIARHAKLYAGSVPIFYTPYLDYPLNDRASGFLFPQFGDYKPLTSEQRTQYVQIPYFLDLDVNQDLTFTLMPMTQRGLALDTQARLLNGNASARSQTQLDFTLLQDQLADRDGIWVMNSAGTLSNQESEPLRWRAHLQSQHRWSNNFTGSIDWHSVSDKSFYSDVPINSRYINLTQLTRQAQLNYHTNEWRSYLQVVDFVPLREGLSNYKKLPELGIHYRPLALNDRNWTLRVPVTASAFRSDDTLKAEANRLHFAPSLQYRAENSYRFWETKAQYNFTQYQSETSELFADTSRSVPQVALHGGLVFERSGQISKHSYTQTLEPEIQYLYVPYREQNAIPLFDSAERSLDFNNLFAMNRFVGADRIGDANQISYALSSRFYDAQGTQRLDMGIGQVVYFSARDVTLTDTTETSDRSDYYLKLGINLDKVRLQNTAQFSTEQHEITNTNSRLSWQPTQKQHWLLSHTRIESEQSDSEYLALGVYGAINPNWQLGLYNNFDLKQDTYRENRLGIRYESCCWSAEIMAERSQLENGLYNSGMQLQIELKGLSTSQPKFKKDLLNTFNF